MAKSSTSWKAGESGNPSGRPKLVAEVRDLARQHTPRAIERLVELMESESGATAGAACKELLDRAWGKSPQFIEQTTKLDEDTSAALMAPDTSKLMERLRKANAGLSHGGGQEAPQEAEPLDGDQPGPGERVN